MTMICEHNLTDEHTASIGSECLFRIERKNDDTTFEYYIKHASILYLKPLTEHVAEDEIRFFPEAPGRYTLVVISNSRHGTSREDFTFDILARENPFDGPQQLSTYNENNLLLPNGWDAKNFSEFEISVWDCIKQIVEPGWSVYDIGANMGIYSTALSRLVGTQGRVYCFEANPMCNYFLQTNLMHEGCSHNCEIIPVAVHNHDGSCEFSINYANTAIGLTPANIYYGNKIGHEINVHCAAIDSLTEKLALRAPQFIKIDIEGAEGVAIEGMQHALAEHHPVLLIEVHGTDPAEQVFPILDKFGYTYQELTHKQKFDNAEALLQWSPNQVFQFICR